MKGNGDVARGWVAKAETDLGVAEHCLGDDRMLDAACFHSQQAAEKFLKAWLIARETEFPFVHDLEELVRVCAQLEPEFAALEVDAKFLTPYAVELRYIIDRWATRAEATDAVAAAKRIRQFVMDRWPTR